MTDKLTALLDKFDAVTSGALKPRWHVGPLLGSTSTGIYAGAYLFADCNDRQSAEAMSAVCREAKKLADHPGVEEAWAFDVYKALDRLGEVKL